MANGKGKTAIGGEQFETARGELWQAVVDAAACYRALRILRGYAELRAVPDREGLDLLLEAIQNRLEGSIEGMGLTARAFGLPNAMELIQ